VTFTATDECGNIAACTANIIIIDDEVIIEECLVNDLVINCSDDIDAEIATWLANSNGIVQTGAENSEGCDAAGEVTVANDYAGNAPMAVCAEADGGLLVTFTATDECGNTAACQANIIILDDEVVIENCPVENLEIACTDDIDAAIAAWISTNNAAVQTAAENGEGCDAAGEITVTNDYGDVPPNAVCNAADGGLLVTFTATDECGNSTNCQGTIIILDNEVVIDACPTENLVINCSDDIDASILAWLNTQGGLVQTAAENNEGCDAAGQITVTNDYGNTPPNAVCNIADGGLLVTFTAEDECGNTAECSATIIIIDNLVNIDNCPTEDLVINCSDDITASINTWIIAQTTAVQNAAVNGGGCDDLGQITVTDNYGDVPPMAVCNVADGGLLVIFTATDECGNTTTCSANIIILDDEVIIENCPTENLVINCTDDADAAITAWLAAQTAAVQTAAENGEGCDAAGEMEEL